MQMNIRVLLFFLFVLCGKSAISAQEESTGNKFSFSISVGYPIGIFDFPKTGYHAAVNVTYPFNAFFELEGQLSFSGMKFKRATNNFAHDGGEVKNLNLVGGIRVYMRSQDRRFRPYVNFLIGFGNGINNEYDDANSLVKTTTGPLGYSTAFNVIIDEKYIVALGVEGPTTNIVAKVGYQF